MSKELIIIFIALLAILIIIGVFYFIGNKNKKIESFTTCYSNQNSPNSNLVKYGSFEGQRHISNSKVGPGNDIITYPNPGDSSYVLRQSTLLSNCDDDYVIYKIRLSLNNKKTYKLSCWVALSNDWNGSNFIFNLRIFNINNNTLKRSEGTQVDSKKMYNILWAKYEYILEFHHDDTGEVNWLLGYQPNNTEGYRYITGVSVNLFNPLLVDFKMTYGLQLFTNTYQDTSYNSSNLTWKDLSNNGRDLKWSQLTSIQNDGGVDTNKINIVGPTICHLGIKPCNNFTIMWMAKYQKIDKCNRDQNIFEILSLYTQNNDLPYIRISIDLYNQQLIVTIGHITYPGISLGLCNSQSLYTLIKSGNRFFIRKDDVQLNTDELFIYQESEKTNFSSQKSLIINPHKDINSEIYAFLIYNYSLNCYEIETVRSYLLSLKKSNNFTQLSSCCSKEKECENSEPDSDFIVPEEGKIIENFTSSQYESTPYQYSYHNSSLNIPRQSTSTNLNKNNFQSLSTSITNYSNSDTIENFSYLNSMSSKIQPKGKPSSNKVQNPMIENFVSSRSSEEESKLYPKSNNDKMSNFKRMLMEQNILSEEESKRPFPPRIPGEEESRKVSRIPGEENNRRPPFIPGEEEPRRLSRIPGEENSKRPPLIPGEEERRRLSRIPGEENSRRLPLIPGEESRRPLPNTNNEDVSLKQEEFPNRPFPETPEESYVNQEIVEKNILPSQELSETTSSEIYQDESTQSKKRLLAEETQEEIEKSTDPSRRESLKLKLKLLKKMIAEEEEEMQRNPLSKIKKLIDSQGETVEEANYEPFSQDTCFNRIPRTHETTCPLDMNEYIKKSDVENQYISKTEVNQDYIKKDSIPCWGCNLK